MVREPGLLHHQAERVDEEGKANGGAILLLGQWLEGLTRRKSPVGGGKVTPPPQLYCGVWWKGTAMRSRSWEGEATDCKSCGKGRGR